MSCCLLDHESVVNAYSASDPKSGLIIDYLFKLLQAEGSRGRVDAVLGAVALRAVGFGAAVCGFVDEVGHIVEQAAEPSSILFKEASHVVDDDESLALARNLQEIEDGASAQRLYEAELAAYRATDTSWSSPRQWSRRRGARVSDAVASFGSRHWIWPRRELEQFRRDKARLAAQIKKQQTRQL